jgi:crotonobetainyl-CoA:carnitine CoA-transferase CaiB-like acyl-CoA transferase
VYCTITGFSSHGPGAKLPGYDLILQALSGVMSFTGEPGGPPLKVGVALIDMIAGLYASTAIVAALEHRHRTGEGAAVEVSLMDSALAALLNHGSGYLNAAVVPGRLGNRHASIAPYQSFRAADGVFVIAGGGDQMWPRVCRALDLQHLAADARYATNAGRVAHVDELAEAIEARTMTQPASHWVDRLMQAGVPAGIINDVAGAFEFAETLGLDSVLTHDRPGRTAVRTVRSPMRVNGAPLPARMPPPGLDEHGAELRRWLGADG